MVGEIEVDSPGEADTVMRALDEGLEIETRHGGTFVQSIEGIEGGTQDGRSVDWFFYVNGVESGVGAQEVSLSAGDRVWWDHRDWSTAMRVPAVVGSWPQPFAGEEDVVIACAAAEPDCQQVAERLADAGAVEPEVRPFDEVGPPGETIRVLVGAWPEISDDDAASLLDDGPESSGVFARFEQDGAVLAGLDVTGAVSWEGQGGLVAATAQGDDRPTWLVTATDPAGVSTAARALAQGALERRYAVALRDDGEIEGLPAAVAR